MSSYAGISKDYFWLLAILALATLLRVIGLDAPLWYDEITTVDTHVRLPWGEMMRDYSMNHHYFFSLQAKASTVLFGDANWVYRLPSVLFGLGTVAAVWWLARDIAGAKIAHVAALLVTLSFHQVWFSQNARGYTELAFWSSLGLIFFLRGMKTPTRGVWVGFGLTLAAAVFTHLTGAFFFLALGLLWVAATLWSLRQPPLDSARILWPVLGAVVGLGLLVIAFLPMVPSLLDTVGSVSESSANDPMQEYQNPVWTLLEGVRTALGSAGPEVLIVALGVIVVIGFGTVAAHRTAPLFAPAVFLHIAVTVILLMAVGMRIWPRFFFVDIGLILILIVLGCQEGAQFVTRLIRSPKLAAPLFALSVVTMVLVSGVLLKRNYTAPKQDMAAAFALVQEQRQPEDRVFTVGGPASNVYQNYFGADWAPMVLPEDYSAALNIPGPVILVVPFPTRMLRAIPQIRTDMNGPLELVERFNGTLGDGDILVLRRN